MWEENVYVWADGIQWKLTEKGRPYPWSPAAPPNPVQPLGTLWDTKFIMRGTFVLGSSLTHLMLFVCPVRLWHSLSWEQAKLWKPVQLLDKCLGFSEKRSIQELPLGHFGLGKIQVLEGVTKSLLTYQGFLPWALPDQACFSVHSPDCPFSSELWAWAYGAHTVSSPVLKAALNTIDVTDFTQAPTLLLVFIIWVYSTMIW